MSYLDLPRLTFSGKFFADPSTLNNTPNNYNANHTFPTAELAGDLFKPTVNDNNIDLFWNPNGSGTFGFVDCAVRSVVRSDGATTTDDPVVGLSLCSNPGARGPYTQAKIVDLDPMQQNVSEIWGMQVGIGDILTGDFVQAAFIGIWLQAKESPPGDTAGSALYQSVLTNLQWSESELVSNSRFLAEIANKGDLSMTFTVRAHNSAPQTYLVDKETVAAMAEKGVPTGVLSQLDPLMSFASHPTSARGLIPTESYFSKLLRAYLDAEGQKYIDTIMGIAKQPYTPATPFPFTYGEVVGAIGLQCADAPLHIPGTRMMTPNPSLPQPKFGPYDPLCNYTPFKVVDICGRPAAALNLANSLPTTTPGSPFYGNKLGNLRLCCFNADGGDGSISKENATPIGGNIDYADVEIFFRQGAGLVDIPIDADAVDKPLGLARVDDNGQVVEILLQENSRGYYLRADRFVYRMQPGDDSDEQNVDIYVTRFGRPVEGEVVQLSLMSPAEAVSYSNNTPGTGGSPGVLNLSVPQSAITIVNCEATTDSHGRACFTIQASDPGNPRDYVDGQIYYLKYRLKSAADGYIQALDDVVSIQVYQKYPLSHLIKNNHPENPLITWDSGVRDILAQYDKLYPVMSFLDLGNYESVTDPGNLSSIKAVLEAEMTDPTHMPVTRDMSSSRRDVLLSWIANGTPRKGGSVCKK